MVYIQNLPFDGSIYISPEDIVKERDQLNKKLANAARVGEDLENCAKVVLCNNPLIYIVAVEWEPTKVEPLAILRLLVNMNSQIVLGEIYETQNTMERYNLQAIICATREKEYNSIYKTNKGWTSHTNELIVSFCTWQSLIKWILLENKVPIMLFYELDKSHNNDTEISTRYIQKLYKYINENKQEEKKEEPVIEEQEKDDPFQWKCSHCSTRNEFPNYICSSISYV